MMKRHHFFLQCFVTLMAIILLSGCAGMAGHSAPHVNLAGIESLPGEGMEMRFMLKLRVQNPGDADLHYDGAWVEVELRGQPLASGGAPVKGVVPRFGEAVVMLPVTASGLNVARQMLSLLGDAQEAKSMGPVAYVIRGRLGGTGLGEGSFESRGEIDLRVR